MRTLIAVARLVHIFAGVVWAGWVFNLAAFVSPAVRAAGPEGGRFMRALAGGTRLSATMTLSSLLVVATGLLMYWHVSGGLIGEWVLSLPGMVVTAGSLAGIAAAGVGLLVARPTAARMAALAQELSALPGPPGAEQLAQMRAYQETLGRAGRWAAILLVVAVAAMAIERSLY